MGPDHRGELHFVVKPTRLSMVRDVAVIAVCALVLAVLVADLLREGSPQVLQVMARAWR
jgi:hypothetical protein